MITTLANPFPAGDATTAFTKWLKDSAFTGDRNTAIRDALGAHYVLPGGKDVTTLLQRHRKASGAAHRVMSEDAQIRHEPAQAEHVFEQPIAPLAPVLPFKRPSVTRRLVAWAKGLWKAA